MSSFRFTPEAERDLEAILEYVGEGSGWRRAASMLDELLASVMMLARHPGAGHSRLDLTTRPVAFWTIRRYGYLVVYRPDTTPVEIVRVLHGARAPKGLRRKLEE